MGLNPSASAFFVFCCIVICEGLAAQGLGVAISAGELMMAAGGGASTACLPAGPVQPSVFARRSPVFTLIYAAVPEEKIALAIAPMITVIVSLSKPVAACLVVCMLLQLPSWRARHAFPHQPPPTHRPYPRPAADAVWRLLCQRADNPRCAALE